MVHKLKVNPNIRPVRQKKRDYGPDQNKIIAEEVDRLLKAGHIEEVNYSDWICNVVLIKKSPVKWRMFNDFTSLNLFCPKYPYPLPRNDQLVDSTARCALLSFMDAFQGFITAGGVYCFKVIPFGLCNAGATYQRLMNLMFKEEIGKSMEVYVDDILVRSKEVTDHIPHLERCFALSNNIV